MEINNPQAFDHIIGINGEIIQPKVLAYADVEIAKIQPEPVIWRKVTADEYHLPPGVIDPSGAVLRVKIVDIGPWDMDTTGAVNVTHGLPPTKIRMVSAMILDDNSASLNPLVRAPTPMGVAMQGNIRSILTDVLTLDRLEGGAFDNIMYDRGIMNRGYVTIWYVD